MSEMKIPKGWELKTLDVVTEKISDIEHKMPPKVETGMPLVSTKDFTESGKIDFSNTKKISLEDYSRLIKTCNPKKDDILFSRIGTIGKSVKVTGNEKFTISYSLALIRPKMKVILPNFLMYFLNSSLILTQSKRDTKSIGTPDLGIKKIRSFEIPMPLDIKIQKEIVQKLDYILGQLEGKVKEINALNHYKKLKNSHNFMIKLTYDAVFSNIGNDWNVKSLDDLIFKSQNGKTGRPNDSIGIPRLGISCITQNNSGFVDETKCKFQEITSKDIETYQIKDRDLLVCRQNGNKSFVGKFSVYSGNTVPLIFSDSLIRFQIKTDMILPEFLMMFMNSSLGRKLIDPFCKTTAGNYSVNGTNLKSIKIPFPSILKQKKLIKFKINKLQQIENTRNQITDFIKLKEKTLTNLGILKLSILDYAFSGKLVN